MLLYQPTEVLRCILYLCNTLTTIIKYVVKSHRGKVAFLQADKYIYGAQNLFIRQEMEGPVEHIALWDMVFYAVRPGCMLHI